KEPWNGITDYCLFHPSGEVLAVVEAKKTSRDPREGQEQLRIYLDKVAAREGQTFVPFGFMTNGQDIFYWDSGTENPRLVAGFFTRDDLKRLLFIRQNGMPLQSASINTSIVERSYQHEAIRRVSEAFANKKRRALLVMAKATGQVGKETPMDSATVRRCEHPCVDSRGTRLCNCRLPWPDKSTRGDRQNCKIARLKPNE